MDLLFLDVFGMRTPGFSSLFEYKNKNATLEVRRFYFGDPDGIRYDAYASTRPRRQKQSTGLISSALLPPVRIPFLCLKNNNTTHKVWCYYFGDPDGIRTRVTAVKGRCLRPLDHRAVVVAVIGLEPMTLRV